MARRERRCVPAALQSTCRAEAEFGGCTGSQGAVEVHAAGLERAAALRPGDVPGVIDGAGDRQRDRPGAAGRAGVGDLHAIAIATVPFAVHDHLGAEASARGGSRCRRRRRRGAAHRAPQRPQQGHLVFAHAGPG